MQYRETMIGWALFAAAIAGFGVAALLAAAAMAPPADAAGRSWSRSGSYTGPAGRTRSWDASRTCSGGSCTNHRSYTGPAGNTWSRDGSGTCSGGTCTYGGTVTGPRGNTGTYSGSITRNP